MILNRILPRERMQIIAGLARSKRFVPAAPGRGLLILGEGGVACQESGEVLGVAAEAPLPRVRLGEQTLSLEGVGGIASILRGWGLSTIVATPMGRGQVSRLQRRLLAQAGVTNLGLRSGLLQVSRYIRRVFAESHQLAHLETLEEIPPASDLAVKRGLKTLVSCLKRRSLLCIVDSGNVGLSSQMLDGISLRARALGTRVLFEPRSLQIPVGRVFDVIKVNNWITKRWFGVEEDSDKSALAVAGMVLDRTGARSVIYTRGGRGILLHQRTSRKSESHLVVPQAKQLFDLVSAGDIVTAAVVFCLAKGCSLLQAACFATSAAEFSLRLRGRKNFNIADVVNHSYC